MSQLEGAIFHPILLNAIIMIIRIISIIIIILIVMIIVYFETSNT